MAKNWLKHMATVRAMPEIQKMGLSVGEMAKKASTMTTEHWSPSASGGKKSSKSKSPKKGKKMKGGQDGPDTSGSKNASGNIVSEGAPGDADNLAALIDAPGRGQGFKPYVGQQGTAMKVDYSAAVPGGTDNNKNGGGKKSRKGKHSSKKGKRSTKKGKKNSKIKMRGGQDASGEANTVPNPDAIAGVIGQVQAALKGTDLAGSTETTPGVLPGKVSDVAANAAADALDAAGGKVNADASSTDTTKVDSDPESGTDANTSTDAVAGEDPAAGDGDDDAGGDGTGNPGDSGDKDWETGTDAKVDSDPETGTDANTSTDTTTGGGRKSRRGRKTKKHGKSKAKKSKKSKKGKKTKKSHKKSKKAKRSSKHTGKHGKSRKHRKMKGGETSREKCERKCNEDHAMDDFAFDACVRNC